MPKLAKKDIHFNLSLGKRSQNGEVLDQNKDGSCQPQLLKSSHVNIQVYKTKDLTEKDWN
jgi:hypothetical protein